MVPCRALWGSWEQGLSVAPTSLITGNSLHSTYMTFPEFQWADSSSCELGKGGDARPGRNSEEQLWGKVLFPHQGVHMTITLSYFADTETPSRWEKLINNDGIMPTSMQTPDKLDWRSVMLTPTYLGTNPLEEYPQAWSRPLWTITVKLVSIFPKWGHLVQKALACCVPLCLEKQ